MNHDEAIGVQATERYLLHELPDQERDAFEEHYFGCAACADDVRTGSAFVGALKSRGRRERDSPFLIRQEARARRNLIVPLAAAASVAVALLGWMQIGVVGPMRVALAEARQPSVPADYPLRVDGINPPVAPYPLTVRPEAEKVH